jgi:hypothetical protein
LANPTRVDRSPLDCASAELFKAAIKSRYTRDGYERRLIRFLKWYGMDCDSFVRSAEENPIATELKLIRFIQEKKVLVERRELTGGNRGCSGNGWNLRGL